MRLLFFLIISVLMAGEACASAAIQQRQRVMQERQQAIRQQQIQAIQQQQAAYQQALISRQQTIKQQALQQGAAAQQSYNTAVAQKLQQVAAQNQAATMSAQEQAIAQMKAQQQAYQQQMAQSGVLLGSQKPSLPSMQMQMPQMGMQQVQNPGYGNLFYTPPVEEVVNITDIWKKMETESSAWMLMIDIEPKMLTVSRMVEHFKNQRIYIKKDPMHYVQMIDSMSFSNPSLLNQPFENIMRVVAIIEYDFDNGQNKDDLARKIFTNDSQFQENKKRLGF